MLPDERKQPAEAPADLLSATARGRRLSPKPAQRSARLPEMRPAGRRTFIRLEHSIKPPSPGDSRLRRCRQDCVLRRRDNGAMMAGNRAGRFRLH